MDLSESEEERIIRRIADYETVSAWFWLCLGIIQVLSILGIIAGIWNIFASITRFKAVKHILARHSNVPEIIPGIKDLVIIGIINLLVGGVIGLIFVVFDYIVRDQVLKNAHLFNNNFDGQDQLMKSPITISSKSDNTLVILGKIEKLAELRQKGILSDEEFDVEKKKILN